MRAFRAGCLIVWLSLMAAPSGSAQGGRDVGPLGNQGDGWGGGPIVAPPTNPGGAFAPGPGRLRPSPVRAFCSLGQTRRSVCCMGLSTADREPRSPWQAWWAQQLQLLATSAGQARPVGMPPAAVPGSRAEPPDPPRRLDDAFVRGQIVPTLLGLVATTADAMLLQAAVRALARAADPATTPEALQALVARLDHPDLRVQSSIALALGDLGDARATPLLRDLLTDTAAGRDACCVGQVHFLVRGFAALSLARIGDDEGLLSLCGLLPRLTDSDREIRTCVVTALGLLGSDHPQREQARGALAGVLSDPRAPEPLVAHAVLALGRLRATDHREQVALLLADDSHDRTLRQSCATALATLSEPDDPFVTQVLLSSARSDPDEGCRGLSLMALAALDRRSTTEHTAWSQELDALAIGELCSADALRPLRPWAALALALAASQPSQRRQAASGRLLDAFERGAGETRAAAALGLGLLGWQPASARLRADLERSDDADSRGHIGVALGLLGDEASLDQLLSVCAEASAPATLRLRSIQALGLLDARRATESLIDRLTDGPTLGVTAGAAIALSRLLDQASASTLLEIVRDEQVSPITRAYACAALGLAADRDDWPLHLALREGHNPFAGSVSLAGALDRL